MEIVLGMLFLAFSNADVEFIELRKLTWGFYIAAEALPTTSRVEVINKREFARIALNRNSETFVVHITTLEVPTTMLIHLLKTSHVQRSNEPTLAVLKWDKALIKIQAEYSDYSDVISTDLAIELPENTDMNEYTIELIEGKQLPYGSIYALSPVESETLKAYIEIHLTTGFIRSSKSLTGICIFFPKSLTITFVCV